MITPCRATFLLVAGGALVAAGEPPLPDALAAGWKGKPACELLTQSADHRMLRCTFAPGAGHERHYHPANFGYALSGGTMRITDAKGTRVVQIATGSSFTSPGTAWHVAENIGTTTVIYLIVEELPGKDRQTTAQ